MQITANHNQSLWDLALIYTGSIESTWDIATRNKRSITDSPIGSTIEIPTGGDPKIVDYLSVRSAVPATDYNQANLFDSTFDNTFIW